MTRSTSAAVELPRLTVIAQCADLLTKLRAEVPGLASATVSTSDGFTVATTLADKPEVDRLSAMSSSMAALASAILSECGRGEADRVILEGSGGQVLSMRVSPAANGLVLTVVADGTEVLGQLLWRCRETARRIADCAAEHSA